MTIDPVVLEAMACVFHCAKCGADTDLAPDDPADTRCYKCCEDHDYQGYSKTGADGYNCIHCGQPAPPDFDHDDYPYPY